MKMLPRFLAFPLLAFIGQFFWMTYFAPNSVASLIWIPVLTYSWFCVGGLSHELIHHNLPIGPKATRTIGEIIGAAIGIPYLVYREVHMRHHAYLNTPLDMELWPYSHPKASLGFRRTFLWFDMLCGSLATPIIYGRICFSSESPCSESLKRSMRRSYAAMFSVWAVTIGFAAWLILSGRRDFRPEALIFLLPLLLAANLNSVRKVMEHLGTSSYDPLHGTRTIVGGHWLTRLLSFFDFDLSIHGPHHRYPKLEHNRLEERMEEIQEAAPKGTYPVFQSFTAALKDTFQTVIANPAVGVNAGCTEDLSHLPGMVKEQPVDVPSHITMQPV